MMADHTGRCLCGAVAYEINGLLGDSVACHCAMCRKTSGHYWSASQVPVEALRIIRGESLSWYRSSETAQRGFCNTCGASLFWEMDGEGMISIASGTLDAPTGTRTTKHIFLADKGDYYDLPANEVREP